MHICIVCNEYPLENVSHGGIGTVVKLLATEYAKHDVRVTVVGVYSFEQDLHTVKDGVHIHALRKSNFPFLRFMDTSKRLLKEIKKIQSANPIDIIESQENGFAFLRPIKGIKYIIRLNGGHHFFAKSENRKIDFWKGFQEKRSFRRSDFFIAVSEYVRDHTSKYIQFDKQKVRVIFNITDTSKFNKVDQTATIRGRILFIGSIKEKKGVTQLVDSFSIVKSEFPKAQLVLAGRGDARFIENLRQRIPKDLVSDVHFLGSVGHDDIPALIATAEVCVYPSHMEALPLAWLEVLASGKPFIGANAGPGPEVVKDGVTGLLCDPYAPIDIATKVIALFKDPELALRLGSQGRADILERFSVEKVIAQNIAFYKEII